MSLQRGYQRCTIEALRNQKRVVPFPQRSLSSGPDSCSFYADIYIYTYIYIQVHTNDSAQPESHPGGLLSAPAGGPTARSPGAQRAAPPPASPALPASPRPLVGEARIALPSRTRVRPLQQTARRLRSRRTGKRQTPPISSPLTPPTPPSTRDASRGGMDRCFLPFRCAFPRSDPRRERGPCVPRQGSLGRLNLGRLNSGGRRGGVCTALTQPGAAARSAPRSRHPPPPGPGYVWGGWGCV